MILLWSSRNGDLRCVRIKLRSELSGYELTGVDYSTVELRRSGTTINSNIDGKKLITSYQLKMLTGQRHIFTPELIQHVFKTELTKVEFLCFFFKSFFSKNCIQLSRKTSIIYSIDEIRKTVFALCQRQVEDADFHL